MGVGLRAHPIRGESHIQRNANREVATTLNPVCVGSVASESTHTDVWKGKIDFLVIAVSCSHGRLKAQSWWKTHIYPRMALIPSGVVCFRKRMCVLPKCWFRCMFRPACILHQTVVYYFVNTSVQLRLLHLQRSLCRRLTEMFVQ